MDIADRLIGKRAQIKRLSDGQVLNGWIMRFVDAELTFETDSFLQVKGGDTFECRVVAERSQASFTAMARSEMLQCADATEVFGSVKIVGKPMSRLQLSVMGEMRLDLCDEPVRIKNEDITLTVTADEEQIECSLMDIAPEGLGVLFREPFEVGQQLSLTIHTVSTTIETRAVVRYCKVEDEENGLHRVGMQFQEMDRLASAAWNRLFR